MDSGRLENIFVASAAFVMMSSAYLIKLKRKRRRRWWMVSLNKSRDRYSATHMLQDLKREPSGKFENFCRMSAVDFEFLLNKIGPLITKRDTNKRKAIPVQETFCVALRFFAIGDSFKILSYLCKMSPQTVSTCVFEECNASC
ncbi:uncharacterized protein [Leptinotarsa decemlineata]|uniref:uncharacterized protein n=1 Tax=Leptinotarsa decemlineata TaxID=7539 RepID=UPI003D305703